MPRTPHLPGDDSGTGDALGPIAFENTLLRQKIVATLRRAIEMGSLKAGDRLVEKDLCLRLGVSRTSLREALRDLEANGVVTKATARELVITTMSQAEAENLYRIRGALEALITEQFIDRATAKDIQSLHDALDLIQGIKDAGEAALEARREYYRLWCKAAGNLYAFEYLMNIQLRLSMISSTKLRRSLLISQDVAEKRAILENMARRDGPAALEAVRIHVRNAITAAFPPQGTGEVD
jgi:DNA-binding GntR family transcriptional regulator